MTLRLLYTRLRKEEKLFIRAAEKRNLDFASHHLGEQFWGGDRGLEEQFAPGDVLLLRCIAQGENQLLARYFQSLGWRTVNSPEVLALCGHKGETSMVLQSAGIPQPEWRLAFSEQGALDAAEDLGYPVVFKPMEGSWGRLLARGDSPREAEAIIEHKMHLSGQHRHLYLQQYVEKGGFDVRAFVIGGEPRCAIRRYSSHWITNTARGGRAEVQPLERDLCDLLRRVQEALGGDFLAVDCFASAEGWLVNEVNGGGEFRNSIDITGVDIPGELLEHCASLEGFAADESKAKRKIKRASKEAAVGSWAEEEGALTG